MTDLNFNFLRRQAELYGLSGRELLDRPDEELAAICNGIGAQWMDKLSIGGKTFSDFLNDLWPNWVVCACIHDVRYHLGGTEAMRKAADEEFRDNCRRVIAAQYGAFDIRRWRGWWEARAAFKVLRKFGEKAFNTKVEASND
jgi:hypothetical protein